MKDKIHKIVERALMPDGTKIQIEDWSEVYPTVYPIQMIAAYPKAKREGWWVRRNESFRLEISCGFESNDEVRKYFDGLVGGTVKLEDLIDYYKDDKCRYYMGLVDTWDRPERN